ncbi:MAG: ATP-binding protein [Coprothermobacterota bacterium]|nr:ATP-binding protein [Coprothermobacterota bacterium]
MNTLRIPRRISTAILNSLHSGVVPRIGLEYFAVGRKKETAILLSDLENIAQGGSVFRLIVGRYGSGKSFMLNLLRNLALDQGFVVMDCDLSLERRLSGSNREGLNTYRELMHNLSLSTRPEGGALPVILERWISQIQTEVARKTDCSPDSPAFQEAMEREVIKTVNQLEGMIHGFDFATVINAYWKGYLRDDETLKGNSLRWLRGEFDYRTQAKEALGVRVIVDEDSWYDYLKLFSQFAVKIGYKGLLVLLDEVGNLYKISNSLSRQNNYEKLLHIFNDTTQGKASFFGVFLAGTPQFLEDQRRGLYSYEALRSRLTDSRIIDSELITSTGPVIKLEVLSPEEIFVLLTRIQEIYASHYGISPILKNDELEVFLNELAKRLGAREFLTPREVARDFLALLDTLRLKPEIKFEQVIRSSNFKPSRQESEKEEGDGLTDILL